MSNKKNPVPERKSIIKDSELGFSKYDSDCGEWLRDNYGGIAKNMYDRHVIRRQKHSYKSKRIESMARDCDSMDITADKDLVLSKIRIALQEKNKHGNKFTVREIEDFCDLMNTTPNEIMNIRINPVHSIVSMSEENICYIQANFERFCNRAKKFQVPCLCFPMLGVISFASFEGTGYWNEIIANYTNRGSSVSVSYKTMVYCEEEWEEYDSGSYSEMKRIFFEIITEIAPKIGIYNLREIPEFQIFIDHFFETEYNTGKDDTYEYVETFKVPIHDSPSA